jgi:hypothetical protein
MPVILPCEAYAERLDPDTSISCLKELYVPYPADLMAVGGRAEGELTQERRSRLHRSRGTQSHCHPTWQ